MSKHAREEQSLGRLADAIDESRAEIERRWTEEMQQLVKRSDLSPTELRNGMPDYLDRLANALRRSESAEASGYASWADVARSHAETRLRLGFDIGELVREFVVLRRVLLRTLEQQPGLVDNTATERLADLIDGAIEAAVVSYVEFRDAELRKQQAEHVAFITHELRNPLTSATLAAVYLRRSSSPSPADERLLATIERNQRRMAELIDGVLLLQREEHALEPKVSATPLGRVLETTLDSAKLAAEAKGLHLECQFDPDVVVQVDPKLVVSAIDNVVLNALKFTDEGEVQVIAEDHPNEVVLHVRDTGPGISDEDLRALFEPFHRGRSGKPGSGLGLAIARRALEVQGGTIHAETGASGGCHFWMTLPKVRH
jgi:signal transduction histidine kinase